MKVRVEPVLAPFPGIARHGVQAKPIGREGVDRTCARIAVVGGVLLGKFALPDGRRNLFA